LRGRDRRSDRAQQKHREQQACDDALHDPRCGRGRPEEGLGFCQDPAALRPNEIRIGRGGLEGNPSGVG
jgi:hypothetical protein